MATINPYLDLGSHTVVIGFNDTLGKCFNNLTKTITVKSTITLPSIAKYTYNSIFSPVLLDSNGNVLKNKEAAIIIDNESYPVKTDANGVIDFNVLLVPGTYELTVINPYTGEFKTQTIKVVKRITENKALTMYFGSGSSYKVRVYDDNGNVAKGVKVTFKINGKTYTRTTDSNGYAALKISLQANTYTVEASYKDFNVSNKIVVKPTLILKDKSVKKSKTFSYTVKLLSNKGKILKN